MCVCVCVCVCVVVYIFGSSDQSLMVNPLNHFSFQPVLQDHGMCCPLCGLVCIQKNPSSRFPFLLSEWSFTICPTPYNRKIKCVELNKTSPSMPTFSYTGYYNIANSVVRAFARGMMDRRIDSSWWTHSAISHSSQCSTTGVTKAVVCAILSVGWCI